MNEIWIPIKGYEKLYHISNLGEIKSLRKKGKKEDKIVKPTINPKSKYLQSRLYGNGKMKGTTYHRLVAIHFIPNPFNLPEVNHKDGNKWNNRADNLEWCTKKYNKQHAVANGLWKMTDSHRKAIGNYNKKEKSFAVIQYTIDGKFIAEYSSTNDAAIAIGASQGNISSCCAGRKYYKTVKGFIFKYK